MPCSMSATKKPRSPADAAIQPFGVRLDEDDHRRLEAWVKELEAANFGATVTKSSLARKIIRDAIERHEAERGAAKRRK